MRVYLDDQPVMLPTLPPPSRPTFAAALAEVRRQAETRGRVVVEAKVDGLAIPGEALADPPEEEYPGAELRFATDDPVDLVRRTLVQVADTLEATGKEQTRAAELIQTGRLDDAMRALSVSLTSWQGVQQVVTSGVTLLGLSLDQLRVPGIAHPLSTSVEGLSSCLGEIKRTISVQDWSGLADVLMIDMTEQAATWDRILRGLADQIAQSGAGAGPRT